MRSILLLLVFLGGWGMAQESVDRLRRAPSFALQEGSGRILELKDLRGKLVLLIFFKPG
ncbi:MAG: hypothetical protein QF752_09310 [Planctomycetota bacterium]|nr:hypothetical protein [Planctomycetota bacterium]